MTIDCSFRDDGYPTGLTAHRKQSLNRNHTVARLSVRPSMLRASLLSRCESANDIWGCVNVCGCYTTSHIPPAPLAQL